MARRVTITFEDGTTHTYEGVPDDITPDQVTQRAQQDFAKSIVNIDGGRGRQGGGQTFENPAQVTQDVPGVVSRSVPLAPVAPTVERSLGENLVGAGETALTAVTGAVAPFLGVGRGVVENIATGGGQRVDRPELAQGFTYQPRTAAGQEMVESLGSLLDASKIPAYVPGAGNLARGANLGRPVAQAAVSQTARTVGTGVTDVAAFPVRAGRGALVNEPFTPSSAMVPLKETYFPQQAVDAYMAGRASLADVEASARPTSELRQSAAFRAAEKILPKPVDPVTGRPAATVALRDRASEAFGERLAEGYAKNPLTLAADLGLPMLGIPPVSPIVRGAQLAADKYISSRLGFAPGFIEKLEADRANAQAIQQLRSQPTVPRVGPGPGAAAPAPVAPVAPVSPRSRSNVSMMLTPDETFARLKGEGSWVDAQGNTHILARTSTGELREQVRNPAGQVIDEKYLD